MNKLYMANFVGKRLKVKSSTNTNLVGLEGTVLDETMNTFTILTSHGSKTVPKSVCKFAIGGSSGSVELLGSAICLRQEDRIREYRRIEKRISRGAGN